MSSIAQIDTRGAFGGSLTHNSRNNIMMQPFAIAPEAIPGDPMDITSPSSTSMGPPVNSSPEIDQGGNVNGNADSIVGIQGTGAAAIAAAQGAKVVQTAFIHKLYNMLEDRSIQHLITWSNTNESFVMSPSNEFSKVLAQYFKHTNISSFVRQLNMYGFHKVSDVFHSGSPDSTLWEFRHGNGNFKKGDLIGLREIKRRASRHALIHRDSFSGQKTMPSQPGTPAEPIPDTLEQRMAHMEHAVYRMNQRMSRTDDSLAMMSLKCQALTDGLVRCHQWSHGLSSHVQSLAPAESSLYLEVSNMQKEIARQLEMVRSLDNSHEAFLAGRQPYFASMSLDPNPPLSPRHIPFDESRRSSTQMLEPPAISLSHGYVGRSSNFPTSPRSYGVPNQKTSPKSNFNRPPLPSHRPSIAATITRDEAPNLARRHTSADIRQHDWPPNLPPLPQIPHNLNTNPTHSPFPVSNNSSGWPSSPNQTPTNTTHPTNSFPTPSTNQPPPPIPQTDHQHIRDQLAAYELNPSLSTSRRQKTSQLNNNHHHQINPPSSSLFSPEPTPQSEHVGWPFTLSHPNPNTNHVSSSSGFGIPKFPRADSHPYQHHSSAPATRRSSMASNVHSLLNPAETREREGEDEEDAGGGGGDREGGGGDERKRKRVG